MRSSCDIPRVKSLPLCEFKSVRFNHQILSFFVAALTSHLSKQMTFALIRAINNMHTRGKLVAIFPKKVHFQKRNL